MLSVVAVVALLSAQVAVPPDWSCDRERFGDGVCDCGCTADDIDCTSDLAADCERDHCGALDPRDGDPKACGPEVDDDDDDDDDDDSCAAGSGSVALAFPLLLRRRHR